MPPDYSRKCFERKFMFLMVSESIDNGTQMFFKINFLTISHNSQENISAGVSFFNKVTYLHPATLLKQRPKNRCFPVNFAKIFKNKLFREYPADHPL